jgi:hypothetical protein
MPIVGLSDRRLAFPEIGKIRKGGKKPEGGIGADLKYFRVEFDEQETAAAKTFTDKYGDKPCDINIVLPFNSIEDVWDAWMEAYTAGQLVARTDNQKYIFLRDTKTGDILVRNGIDVATNKERPYVPGEQVGTDYNGKPVKCKSTGRLKIVIPELQRLAYLTVLTGSKNDIANISGQLAAIEMFCRGLGKGLGGTPLVLRRRPHMISCPDPKDKSKRVRREKWLLSIEADPEFVKRALLETKRLALPGNGLALPAPEGPDWGDLSEDEGEEEDEVTGEVTEEEPASFPGVAAEDQPKQPEKKDPAARPWDATMVKGRVMNLVAEYTIKKSKATEDDRKVVAAILNTTFKGDQGMRYTMTRFLFPANKTGSTKDMTDAQVRAVMSWQGVSTFTDAPSAEAITEAISCYTAGLEAEGQQKLI